MLLFVAALLGLDDLGGKQALKLSSDLVFLNLNKIFLFNVQWIPVRPLRVVDAIIYVQVTGSLRNELGRQLLWDELRPCHEVVTQYLIKEDALGVLNIEALVDEVFSISRYLYIRWKVKLSHLDLLVDYLCILSVEGQLSDEHHVDTDANTPHINLEAMAVPPLLIQDLRGQVVRRSQ